MQTSLTQDVQFVGTGLHSGRPARLTIHPAGADHGIWFRRTDIKDRDNLVEAKYNAVSDTRLNTRLSNAVGVSVSTVEHLMAAVAGSGLHNALIDIDGPEVPIMDGSAKRFVRDILDAGLVELSAPIKALRIVQTVEHVEGDAVVRLEPFDGFQISFEIDFPDAAIGRQEASFDMMNGTFVRELSDCRTFCRAGDVEAMKSAGLALGGTLDNAVVVDGAEVLNPEGFRRADECVRHKMLDALGDMSLAGMPIIGHYVGARAGHGPSNRLLRKLFATPGAFEIVTCAPEQVRRLPGFGIRAADLAEVG
ncbi:MAG: UDP-3-O-acyl-N-acetylglucosamine deacetylase [Pseudomonadota bacterium]